MNKPTILLWLSAVIAALGGFLFGFDMAVISGVLPLVSQQFSLSPALQGWFVSSALLGCLLGVSFSGKLSDNLGRKLSIQIAGILFLVSALGCGLSSALWGVIAFRIFGGIGVGIASSIVPLYLSEIAPAKLRGRMVTYYQLAVTIGILAAYLSNAVLLAQQLWLERSTTSLTLGWFADKEIWRAMFLVGALPSLVFFIGILFVPESPRWLMDSGQFKAATQAFSKLGLDPPKEIQNDYPGNYTKNSGPKRLRDLLSPKFSGLLFLGVLLPLFSQFSGINAIIYYGPSLLKEMGMSLEHAMDSQLIFGVVNTLCTIIAIGLVDKLGRRPLYLVGSALAFISLGTLGYAVVFPGLGNYFMLITVFIFLASFAFSMGPLKFVVASEIFPSAVRGRAMAMSITVMWIADLIVGQLTPMMISRWGVGVSFWVFGCFCFCAFVVVYRLLPETKGMTLEEIEQAYHNNEES